MSGGSSSSVWQDLKLEPFGDCGNGFVPESSLVENKSEKYGLSPDVAVMGSTAVPVTKGLVLNFRWGLNFPGNLGLKMPYLTVNKIGLERVVEEVKQNKQSKDTSDSDTDLQLLKGVCFWMTRDLENVEKENREIKRVLDEMKIGASTRNHREGRKLSQHSGESSSKFEHWRSNKSGREEDEQKEPKKSQILVSDVESELQKAIKAASS